MTGDVVIRAEGLGKKYVIGHQSAERPSTFRDAIVQSARGWGRSARDMIKGAANVAGDEIEEFWALKDVNFEINRGDVVGIIGRNGAGKSTLLKVLSRITEPSEGRVEIKGRIASLLEVGTGFHPELSGRENIYLNGAILGMSRDEIKRKFDEIVDFAEIEKFLDTPVKRYSSGMYVRLAFAVAAHLEPEILIVDEVLAVGDAEFQKKCLGKMRDVAGHGRTVLFVSHNMAAVRALCPKAIYLKNGSVAAAGNTPDLISTYRLANETLSTHWQSNDPTAYDNPYFRPHSLSQSGSSIKVIGEMVQYSPLLFVGCVVETADELPIFWTHHRDAGNTLNEELVGKIIEMKWTLPLGWLNSGRYKIRLAAFLHNREFLIEPQAGPFITIEIPEMLDRSADFEQPRPGIFAPQIDWTVRSCDSAAHYSAPEQLAKVHT